MSWSPDSDGPDDLDPRPPGTAGTKLSSSIVDAASWLAHGALTAPANPAGLLASAGRPFALPRHDRCEAAGASPLARLRRRPGAVSVPRSDMSRELGREREGAIIEAFAVAEAPRSPADAAAWLAASIGS